MYTAVSGIFENAHVVFKETPPTTKKMKVIVTFLEEVETTLPDRQLGSLL